jgi:hypothetical protein
MMALLPIILFVTTDIYEKVKMYSNDDKTDECNKNAFAVVCLCRQLTFSKKLFVFS